VTNAADVREPDEHDHDHLPSDDDVPGLTIEEIDRVLAEPWVTAGGLYGRGEANLRAWLMAGRPAAERDKLCVSGAPEAVRMVRALVDKLPEAVAWHLVRTTAISWQVPGLGLTGPWPTPPPQPETRIDMAFEVSERNMGLCAHELAHAWHRDPELFGGLTSAEIEMLDEMVAAKPGAAERTERADITETTADRLASAWLGVRVATSSTREHSRRLATPAGSKLRGGDQ
jgi:hypothetical protein